MNTAIIGAGFVGPTLTITFARAGHEVRVRNTDPAAPPKVLDFIQAVLPDLAAIDLLGGATPAAVMGGTSPDTVGRAADLMLDCAQVPLGMKREILDRQGDALRQRQRHPPAHAHQRWQGGPAGPLRGGFNGRERDGSAVQPVSARPRRTGQRTRPWHHLQRPVLELDGRKLYFADTIPEPRFAG